MFGGRPAGCMCRPQVLARLVLLHGHIHKQMGFCKRSPTKPLCHCCNHNKQEASALLQSPQSRSQAAMLSAEAAA